MNVILRTINKKDYEFILRINRENVEVLSPMDIEKLKKFADDAALFLTAEIDGKQAGFIIALKNNVSWYDSENYLWFGRNFDNFLYIDRVVIDEPYRHYGIGRKMYKAVFDFAKENNIPYVTAEIDTVPYNEASLNFHKAMGFNEVGTQSVRNNTIQVSLQTAKIK